MQKPISVVLLSASILTACGGGGGGGSPEPVTDLIKVSQLNVVADEGTSISVPFTSTANDIAFTATDIRPRNIGTFSVDDSKLNLTLGETDRPGLITGVLYSREHGFTHPTAKTINVVINNTSASAVESRAESLVDQKLDILALTEDQTIYNFLLDLAYLNGVLEYSEKISHIDSFNVSNSMSYALLVQDMSVFEEMHQYYVNGLASDSELASSLESVEQSVFAHGEWAKTQFSNIQSLSDPFISDLTSSDLEYDSESGRYSRFIGQEAVGSYSGGTWSFSPGYELLDFWVPKNTTDNFLMCEAVN